MLGGFLYILQSLVDLYLITVGLRLAMQWVRADFRNPIVQFVVKITDPIILPLQKFLPSIYKIDLATLIVFFLLQWAATGLLAQLTCASMPGIGSVLGLALIRGARMLLDLYFFIVIGYVIVSWLTQGAYNPSIAMLWGLLKQLAQPVLQPVQKFIPPIAGLDLSPLFLLLVLGAVSRMLLGPAQQIAGNFLCPLGAIL